ncbi:MAG: alkaline phosphatase family protein [Planctomycetota bacterium]
MKTATILLLLGTAIAATACGGDPDPYPTRMVVIGMDGLDPNLLDAGIAAGEMPNFAMLAKRGDYLPLGTSLPPESPVAWANFITGTDPGGHGIFDFIHRRIRKNGVTPVSSMASTTASEDWIPLFGYRIPFSPGETTNMVRGRFFWEYLDEAGVPTTIVRAPDNFPPRETGARTFSGMGTPDLLGTMGVFSLYVEETPPNRDDFDGKAELYTIRVLDGAARSVLRGPDNDYRLGDDDRPSKSLIPVTIYPDRERKAARIDVGDEIRLLAEGEWSGWVPVSFPMIPNVVSAGGMVRIWLKSVTPLTVYVSPINIDPRDPAQDVSTPSEAAPELAGEIGPYYTQGMAEETNGARLKVLGAAEFTRQIDLVMDERERMLDVSLSRFDEEGGFLFFYVSTSDLSAHILYQYIDPDHPLYDAKEAEKYGGELRAVYRRMDRMLGKVLESVPEGTRVVVMSDHGFAPVRRKLSVNTWLYENGFLALREPEMQGSLEYYRNIDWLETKAYGVGFQGIYLNLYGRERTGLVNPDEAERVKSKIIRGLEALIDPKTGEKVVTKVYRREEVYHGDAVEDAPDLVIGFNRGYENADKSALGGVPKKLLEDNLDPWSGSHLMDPSHVPGVLLANTKFRLADPRLIDLTATVLKEFGIEVKSLPGRPIW